MVPGHQPAPSPISPISRISPSRYLALDECGLRGVWSSNGAEVLLPLHPNVRLGTAIHRIFEKAGKGDFGIGDQRLVEESWNEAIAALEAEMRLSWLECSLLPLSKSINNFEVQRLRVVRKALEISNSFGVPKQKPMIAKRGFGFELWVKTPDGEVGGFIDRAFEIDGKLVLEDYKTGLVMEQNPDGDDVLKTAYVIQLQLYAALYAFTFGQWPDQLHVVSTQGSPIAIDVDREASLQLIVAAKAKLHTINEMIRHPEGTNEDIQNNLASPSPDVCRRCLFRPSCQAYISKSCNDEEGWPIDRIGVLIEQRTFANGFISLTVEDGNDLCVIRSVSPGSRHPALETAKLGNRVGCFNLRRTAGLNQYQETAYTTIYLM
jgi:hypothetical protein